MAVRPRLRTVSKMLAVSLALEANSSEEAPLSLVIAEAGAAPPLLTKAASEPPAAASADRAAGAMAGAPPRSRVGGESNIGGECSR